MARSTSQYMAVVAIDFGTTFSGFAFSFNHREGERGILVNKAWGNDQGYQALKTPTCLLLDTEQQFHSFGFDAKEKYAQLEGADHNRQFYFFDLFKMELYKEGEGQTITSDTTLTARNGKRLRAIDVFAHALRFLKDQALDVMRERTDVNFTTDDIQWVLTVPAIWQPSARQFMRDAAYKANLLSPANPDQLIIALEPEAASLWCRQRQLVEFAEEKGEALVRDAIARNGTSYIVVDCGGGTVDITAHHIQPDDSIHEIFRATGGAWGGGQVNLEFEMRLKSIFGEDFIDNFKNSHPSDWLDIIGDFEMKKRSTRPIEDKLTRIRLTTNFVNYYRCFVTHRNTDDIQEAIEERYPGGDVTINGDYLCLKGGIMRDMFEPAVRSIVEHIRNLLRKPQLRNVKYFFLVGGFSGSAVLQKAIRDNFKNDYRILVPAEPDMAIVKGAVMFGKTPKIIQRRISARTYGVGVNMNFIEGYHPTSKKFYTKAGTPKCRDIFSTLLTINEVVRLGESKTFTFYPVEPDQSRVTFDFYMTKSENPKYVDDKGVIPEGCSITVRSPNISKGTNRDIELKIEFGGTEIKATAIDVDSRLNVTSHVNLITRDRNEEIASLSSLSLADVDVSVP
ncbi:heat shock 70 kDa protein 12A-like [Branchiostoma floridae]|uniref:Heat shock 70 kDa protein 12A-like n=1 Tax=Branchiostoma floridae TaxID=7739 RepID=A0A9J7LXP7_BRAFL|nr:heat shock 70 kDa protein 12A-like [Branchiostoma floridae]